MDNKPFNALFRSKDGRLVIWQRPNWPLWVWIIATGLGLTVGGIAKNVVGTIGLFSLAIWAVMEIRSGDSLFRRILGGVVLAIVLVTAGRKLFG